MTNRSVIAEAQIGAISWVAGYFVTLALSDGLSSSAGYAVVVGWWFCAYTASVFALPLLVAVPLGAMYFLTFSVTAIVGKPWLYHDVESLPLLATLGVGLLQSVLVASPIVFNRLVGLAVSFLKSRLR